jgi:hypothetical protein
VSECNGWSSRETWLVNLYGFFDDDYFEENKFSSVEEASSAMADSFMEWFADEVEALHPFLRDCICLSAIDWRELAEAKQEYWQIEDEDDG